MANELTGKRPADEDLDNQEDPESKSKKYRIDENGPVLDNGDNHYAVADAQDHLEDHQDHVDYNHHESEHSGGDVNDMTIQSISDVAPAALTNHINDSPADSISGGIEEHEDHILQDDQDHDQDNHDENGYDVDEYGGHSLTDLNEEGLLDSPALPPPVNPIDYSATPSNAPPPSMPGHPVSGLKEVEVSPHIQAAAADPTTNREQLKYAITMIKLLRRNKDCLAFLEPVDPVKLGLPTYFSVVTYPMDSSTILRKLEANQYPNIMAVIADCNAMFMNCYRFNGVDHIISKQGQSLARTLQKYLEKAPLSPKQSILKSKRKSFVMPGQPQSSSRSGSSEAHDPLRPKREIHAPTRIVPDGSSPKGAKAGKRLNSQLKFAGNIIRELHKKEFATFTYPFLQPVDPVALAIPHYRTIIKHPMDLGTIKKRFDAGHYTDAGQVEHDIRLTINNAKKFNQPGEPVHEMARKLEQVFESKWREMPQFVASAPVPPTFQTTPSHGASGGTKEDSDDDEEEDESSDEEAPPGNSQIELLQQNLQLMTAQLNLLQQQQALQQARKKKKNKEKRKSISGMPGLPMMPFGMPGVPAVPTVTTLPPAQKAPPQAAKPKQPKTPKAQKSTAPSAANRGPTSLPAPGSKTKLNAGAGAKKKEKKKADESKDLTYEQKLELSNKFTQGLSEETMAQVFSIIREGMPGIDANANEELELDIDNLDPITLRRLYNYVVKGKLSKSKKLKPVTNIKAHGSDSSSSDDDSDSDAEIENVERPQHVIAKVDIAPHDNSSPGATHAVPSPSFDGSSQQLSLINVNANDLDTTFIVQSTKSVEEYSSNEMTRTSTKKSIKRRIESHSPDPNDVIPHAKRTALDVCNRPTDQKSVKATSNTQKRATARSVTSQSNDKLAAKDQSVGIPQQATGISLADGAMPLQLAAGNNNHTTPAQAAQAALAALRKSSQARLAPSIGGPGFPSSPTIQKKELSPAPEGQKVINPGPSIAGSAAKSETTDSIQKALTAAQEASRVAELERQQRAKEQADRETKERTRLENNQMIRAAQDAERERRRALEVDYELAKMRGQTLPKPLSSRVPREELGLCVERMENLLPDHLKKALATRCPFFPGCLGFWDLGGR